MTLDEIEAGPANIGHNSGGNAEAIELIERTLRRSDEIEKGAADYLAAENGDLMRRLRDIEAAIARGLPSRIDSQAEAEKLSDLRFAVKKWITAAKQARTAAKRPWDAIAKSFYAFFTRPIDDLETVDAEKIGPVLTDWQDREAARKRRDEEERARILREEADRKMREAAEAETRRLEAEKREREAREAAERAERDRLAAIEAAAKAKREREEQDRLAKEAAERAKREEAERKARAEREAVEKAERDRLEAEARAQREAARKAEEEAAEARRAELRRQEAEHKEAAAKARREREEAERAAIAARKEIRAEARNESEAVEAAERADKNADKSEEKAHAKPADLSRVRGEHGSVSSLRRFYAFRNLDRAELDLESLRQHLPIGGLETAVRSFIDAGGTSLRGVEIFEDQTTVTR